VEELRRTIALLFRRKGGSTLSEKEFVLSASMDLRWFPPRDGQRLLQAGVESRLLQVEGGHVSPTFDVAAVEVPLDFRPSPSIFEVKRVQDPFLAIVERVQAATGGDPKIFVAQVNEVQGRLGVHAEAAALLVARAWGVEVSDLYPIVGELILRRATPRTGGDRQG
jgi:hypothetical protein